ncbi:ABC transporter substrate-binding protein [Salinimicrobium marinum]|uniref:ABC transporter substrate-binding protein n=1 Tax=Salinimicrobium marinum TaxID=680283 RepID=A0A918VWV1_9FLAO|nr:substrate-binding domain-containing protein [Salinimicrobium marinum]GHA30715.1 ABC transporter substrate-binding protein [Salinimicrobium marinum]
MKNIRVGGVPEHFNLPWHLSMENKDFEKQGLELTWKDFPDGTGAMCKALRDNEIDVSVILTEGIIKDIIAGNKVKIVQEYIGSSLKWGIHVAEGSGYKNLEDLQDEKVAISRYGSGSHLMAFVNARRLGWEPDKLEFEVVTDIEGAVKALKDGDAAYFMWEHFTTKPLVDRGIFRRLGDCPTPWPCFVIAVREEFLKENQDAVKQMLDTLNYKTKDFKEIPGIEKQLSERYGQKEEDIKEWLKMTSWSRELISETELDRVQDHLKELDLIPEKVRNSSLIHPF